MTEDYKVDTVQELGTCWQSSGGLQFPPAYSALLVALVAILRAQ